MSSIVEAVNVAEFFASVAQDFFRIEGKANIEAAFKKLGLTATAVGDAFAEDPLKATAETFVGLAVITALGPAIASAGAVTAAALGLTETFGIGALTAQALATALVSSGVSNGAETVYGGALDIFAKLLEPYGASIAQLLPGPNNTITSDQVPLGTGVLFITPNGSPLLFHLPNNTQLNAGLLVSTDGITALPINQNNLPGTLNSWSSISADGSLLTVVSTQQAVGALVSVGNTYDARGNLTQVTETFANGHSITFDHATYSGISFDSANNILHATLMTPFGTPVGVLNLNALGGDGTFTILDGPTFHVPVLPPKAHIHDPVETPEQVLLDYLSDLGISATVASLDQTNSAFLNPVGASYNVTGNVQKVDDTHANVFYSVFGTPGAVVAGQPTAVITDFVLGVDAQGSPIEIAIQVNAAATNILAASGNISQDAITGIQQLNASGLITLSRAQFLQFSSITGGGIITAADGGTFDLNDANIDPNAHFNLVASDWSGTTLIGSNNGHQTLTASLFGDDRLIAGNGVGDTLVAGEGVNTLIGGTGGDTFVVPDGLAAGSMVIGKGGDNVLQADGDISLATITGVQKLATSVSSPFGGGSGNVTLNATEFNGFGAITGGGTIEAATGGIYDLSGKSIDHYNLTALSNNGTTLIGNAAGGEHLTASESGDDTLIVGDSAGNSLTAQDTFGNDTLTAGNGASNVLNASDSVGDNRLTIGSGGGGSLTVSGSSGDNVLTAHDTSATHVFSFPGIPSIPAVSLSAIGSLGENILSAGDGNGDLLDASGSLGNNILTVGNGNADRLSVDTFSAASGMFDGGSFGDNDLTAGNGANDWLSAVNSSGNNKLTTGDGNHDLLNIDFSTGDNTLVAGDGESDQLVAYTSAGDNTLTAGNGAGDSLDVTNTSGNNMLKAGDGADDTLTALDGMGNNTLVAGNGDNDVLKAGGEGQDGLAFVVSAGNNILSAGNGNNDVLDVSYSAGNNILTAGDGSNDVLTAANSGGNDTLMAGNGDNDSLYAGIGANTLIVGNGNHDQLFASIFANSGVDTLTAGDGTDDLLVAGGGVDILIGGNGGDTFSVPIYSPTAGSKFIGGTGSDTLVAAGAGFDFTGSTISGIETLKATLVGLTADQFAGFSTIDGLDGSTSIMGTTGGVYSFVGKTVIGPAFLQATSSEDATLIANNADFESLSAQGSRGNDTLIGGNGDHQVLVAGSGTDTLIGGNGSDHTLVAGSGNDRLVVGNQGDMLFAGTGTDILTGGPGDDTFVLSTGDAMVQGNGGNDSYVFAGPATDANFVIDNFHADGGKSVIEFQGRFDPFTGQVAGVNAADVTFTRSGDSLVLTIASDPITIENYFAGVAYKIGSIHFADGGVLTSQQIDAMVGTSPAQAAFEEISGGGVFAQSGHNYSLTYNLDGASSSATFNLGVLNNAIPPSDQLAGSFTVSGSNNFALSGLTSFTGLNPGQADTAPTVTFHSPGQGTYIETITLHATDSTTGVPLPDEILTVTVNVASTNEAPPHLAFPGMSAVSAGPILPSDRPQIEPSAPAVSLSHGGDGFVFANIGASVANVPSDWPAADHDQLHSAFNQTAESMTNGIASLVGAMLEVSLIDEPHVPPTHSLSPPDGFHLV
jgi:Ca2+-binding RTX toxin-like protein